MSVQVELFSREPETTAGLSTDVDSYHRVDASISKALYSIHQIEGERCRLTASMMHDLRLVALSGLVPSSGLPSADTYLKCILSIDEFFRPMR